MGKKAAESSVSPESKVFFKVNCQSYKKTPFKIVSIRKLKEAFKKVHWNKNIKKKISCSTILSNHHKLNLLKFKQPAHDKGTLDSADTLLYKALTQGHTVNSDILG